MATNNKAYKGTFIPNNKEKYRGDWKNITYRSSWELFIMKLLDNNPDVKQWNSEEIVIPYFSTADGKKRRYFIDMAIWWNDGSISLWEIKPDSESRPPIPPIQNTSAAKKKYMNQLYTYQVNMDKWKQTVKICNEKGWRFNIITETALKKMGFKGIGK